VGFFNPTGFYFNRFFIPIFSPFITLEVLMVQK